MSHATRTATPIRSATAQAHPPTSAPSSTFLLTMWHTVLILIWRGKRPALKLFRDISLLFKPLSLHCPPPLPRSCANPPPFFIVSASSRLLLRLCQSQWESVGALESSPPSPISIFLSPAAAKRRKWRNGDFFHTDARFIQGRRRRTINKRRRRRKLSLRGPSRPCRAPTTCVILLSLNQSRQCSGEESRSAPIGSKKFQMFFKVTGGLRPGGLRPGGLRPGGLRPGGIEPTWLRPRGIEPTFEFGDFWMTMSRNGAYNL